MPNSYICFGLSLDLTILSSVAFLFLPCANAVSFEFTVAQFCLISDWELYYIVLYLYCHGKSEGKVVSDSATPWTAALQAPLSMGFSRQEYWSGLLLPSPGDLPNPGIKPRSPALQIDSFPTEPPGKSSW